MLETNANSERLQRSYNELVELQLVLEKVRGWRSLPAAVAAAVAAHHGGEQALGSNRHHVEQCTQLHGQATSVCCSIARGQRSRCSEMQEWEADAACACRAGWLLL